MPPALNAEKPGSGTRFLVVLAWLFSLPSLGAFLAYRGLGAHYIATSNRLDNINFLGPTAVVIFVWCCHVTQGIASILALFVLIFRRGSVAGKLLACAAAAGGWFMLYTVLHTPWPPHRTP